MSSRKQQLFDAKKTTAPNHAIIPATVKFVHDKKKGVINPLEPHEKMICALRKALAVFSDKTPGQRFYIIGNKIQLLQRPAAPAGKKGEAKTYTASGRCRLGVAHDAGHTTSKVIQFSITFRDTTDARGLDDVEYLDPTTIDELPKNTPIDVTALA